MFRKTIVVLTLFLSLISTDLFAQKYGGSRSSGGSSFKSSGRSYSSPSRSSSSSSSFKPSKSSSSSSSFKSSKPSTSSTSSKPTTSFKNDSSKSSLQTQSSSKANYTNSTKPKSDSWASKPSKPVTPINTTAKKAITTKPATEYTPKARESRYTKVINNNYSHPYSYYAAQPQINIGGGWSPVFWYMMGEWSADRRAEWLYHHGSTVNTTVYNQTLEQNPEVKAKLEELKEQNVPVNPEYTDKDFKDNPDLMYTQTVVEQHVPYRFPWGSVLEWFLIGCGVSIFGYVMFFQRFGR